MLNKVKYLLLVIGLLFLIPACTTEPVPVSTCEGLAENEQLISGLEKLEGSTILRINNIGLASAERVREYLNYHTGIFCEGTVKYTNGQKYDIHFQLYKDEDGDRIIEANKK